MARKRTRPADPLTIARRREAQRLADRDPRTWGVDPISLGLAANADIEARADVCGHGLRAQRRDVFERLLGGQQGNAALAAVRRLQADLAARHAGCGGVARYAARIDAGPAEDPFAERRLRAGGRARRVLSLTGTASARLLLALMEPDAALGKRPDWRAVVERETGERLADAQAGALRAACVNLAEAYADLDRSRP
ncbi:MAG TPA: hypothetical protein VGF71_13580 [Caulobacteraceae bacterium]|jgi:hypothetical protein